MTTRKRVITVKRRDKILLLLFHFVNLMRRSESDTLVRLKKKSFVALGNLENVMLTISIGSSALFSELVTLRMAHKVDEMEEQQQNFIFMNNFFEYCRLFFHLLKYYLCLRSFIDA